jgi:3-oxoacyl-[acyl-carrier protein] reductase
MRSVVVTGASRGLGLGIAEALVGSGYLVIAVARSVTPALTAAMAATPDQLQFHAADLSDIAGLPELAKALRERAGTLYGLVNNAGIGTAGILSTMPDAQIQQLVGLNVISPLTLTKYLVRPMMAARSGRVVNISSVVAATGYSGLSVYSATKASLLGFTRSLARELGPLGITVNAVAPGFVDTEMTHDLTPPQREQIKRRSALRRMPGVTDVANAVEYLLSDKAANITGTVMTIDAGNTA